MGALFSNCQLFFAKRQATKGNRKCGVILKQTEQSLQEMRQKYEEQLEELSDAINAATRMPQNTAHQNDKRRKRLMDLLARRKMLNHYLSTTDKRLHMINSKMLSLDQLQISAMQIDAVRSVGQAFQTFHKRVGGLEKIENASDKLSEQMDFLTDLTQVLENEELYPMLQLDDSDLLQELEEFEQETSKEGGGSIGPAAAINVAIEDLLPAVPAGAPETEQPADPQRVAVALGERELLPAV